ncbi:porin family protein [Vibrio clamense]|uniref:porin family protein n=1 Tax=Vibrio clamense TaxID=2910254 RepID=UPI003D1AE2CD
MFRRVLLIGLVVSSFFSHAQERDSIYDTPTRYDYLYATVSSGSFDSDIGGNSNVTTWNLGGNGLVTEHWLVAVDYSARFVNLKSTDLRIDTLLAGGGYRFKLREDLDLVTVAQVGAIKAKETLESIDKTLYSESEFVYAGSLYLNYAFTEKTEGRLAAEFNRSDWIDENITRLEVNHYITSAIALGGFYTYRKANSHYSNEAGVSFRVLY